MAMTANEKRKALKAMMQQPVCHLAPSCNDGIQARLVEWQGFPLVHISGSGQHRSLGFADAGLLTLTEMINKAREIVDAVEHSHRQRRRDGLRQCRQRLSRGQRNSTVPASPPSTSKTR